MILCAVYPTIDMEATGENIKRLVNEKGITLTELACFFNFTSQQAIYKWYWGQSLPSVDNLFALSRVLGVPIDSILVERDPLGDSPEDLFFVYTMSQVAAGACTQADIWRMYISETIVELVYEVYESSRSQPTRLEVWLEAEVGAKLV